MTAPAQPTVFVVDDDEAIRNFLDKLLSAMGLLVRTFASAQAFLDEITPAQPGCLVADILMPGMSGLELQDTLQKQDFYLPILFITGYADVPMARRALKRGAIDFIQKPLDPEELIATIHQALAKDQKLRAERERRKPLEDRLKQLTERESQVLALILEGLSTKLIARELTVSVRTTEIHRTRILKKMGADTSQELMSKLFQSGLYQEMD